MNFYAKKKEEQQSAMAAAKAMATFCNDLILRFLLAYLFFVNI